MKTPSYQKWYDMRALCVPRQSTRTTTPTEPTYHPGQILAQAEGDKSKGPPSNGESENISGDFEIPFARQEDGTEESILATCKLTISVEDWGTGLIDGEQLIDCTASKEAPNNLGGHATWGGTASKTCASGAHSYGMTAQNITMPEDKYNKFVCKYSFEAVCPVNKLAKLLWYGVSILIPATKIPANVPLKAPQFMPNPAPVPVFP